MSISVLNKVQGPGKFGGKGSIFQRTYSAIPLNTTNTPLGSSEFSVLNIDLDLTNDWVSVPGVIHDFSRQEFLDSIAAQTALVTDWQKPVVFKFIDRTKAYFTLTQNVNTEPDMITIKSLISDSDLISIFGGDTFELLIQISTGRVGTQRSTKRDFSTLFLRENGDRTISAGDVNLSLNGTYFNLSDFSEKGNYPVLYLRTARSENYYPAYYGFTNEKPQKGNIPTKIGCIYVKEADGKKYLVTDEIICAEGIKWNSMVTYNYSEIPLN